MMTWERIHSFRDKQNNQIHDKYILTRLYDYVLLLHMCNRPAMHGCNLDDFKVRYSFLGSNRAGNVGTG